MQGLKRLDIRTICLLVLRVASIESEVMMHAPHARWDTVNTHNLEEHILSARAHPKADSDIDMLRPGVDDQECGLVMVLQDTVVPLGRVFEPQSSNSGACTLVHSIPQHGVL